MTCLKRDVLFLLLGVQQLNPSSTGSRTISYRGRQTQDTDEWKTLSLKDRNIDRSYAVPFSFGASYIQMQDKSESFTLTTAANKNTQVYALKYISVCLASLRTKRQRLSVCFKPDTVRNTYFWSFPCLPRHRPFKGR